MINLASRTAKQRARIYIERQMQAIENNFVVDVLTLLKRQFKFAAMLVSWSSFDTDHAVDQEEKYLRKLFIDTYKRIYVIFGDIIFKSLDDAGILKRETREYEIKTIGEEYTLFMDIWSRLIAAQKIIGINRVTKRLISEIIRKGKIEELSNKELSEKITAVSDKINPARAMKIARTETHTLAMKSMNTAMSTTRLQYTKQWFTAGDKRVRMSPFNHEAANEETVGKNDYYIETGEEMFYPGDEAGSAANVIHCRCIETYDTIRGGLR